MNNNKTHLEILKTARVRYFNIIANKYCILFALVIIGLGCGQKQTMAVPQTPLQQLLSGNERFTQLKPMHSDEVFQPMKVVTKEQHPFAVVVCCSDSRVSPELIFDKGIGDLFVIRTPGNIIGDMEIGGIEYAVEHLGTKLVVIMGHENCTTIKTFIEKDKASGHFKAIIDSLKQQKEIKAIPYNDPDRLDKCVIANLLHGIKQLQTQSPPVMERIQKKELQVIGARYDLDDFKISIVKM